MNGDKQNISVFEETASQIVEFFDGSVDTKTCRALVYRLEACGLLRKDSGNRGDELSKSNGSQKE